MEIATVILNMVIKTQKNNHCMLCWSTFLALFLFQTKCYIMCTYRSSVHWDFLSLMFMVFPESVYSPAAVHFCLLLGCICLTCRTFSKPGSNLLFCSQLIIGYNYFDYKCTSQYVSHLKKIYLSHLRLLPMLLVVILFLTVMHNCWKHSLFMLLNIRNWAVVQLVSSRLLTNILSAECCYHAIKLEK